MRRSCGPCGSAHGGAAADTSVSAHLTLDADPALRRGLGGRCAALIGLLLAASAWRWTQLTGSHVWDAVASLAIAVLLVIIAIGLGRQNAEHLIGKAVSPDMQEGIVEQIRDADGVDAVIER